MRRTTIFFPYVDVWCSCVSFPLCVYFCACAVSKQYADPVLDRLDPDRSVAHRLFRESCYNHRGNYVKVRECMLPPPRPIVNRSIIQDLSQLGRPIEDTIIIDNSPASYIFHPNNAVPISSWFNDPHDTELNDLCPFLADLGESGHDVRGILNPAA